MSDQTNTTQQSYNGWTNYETWNVALWLDNDEGTYTMVREFAADAVEQAGEHPNVPSIWTKDEAARYELAERIEAEVKDMAPDLGASVFSDLLNAALSEVNWDEISANILAES